ncbi:SDR family NAD(P)-dependent oxidoreductase [Mycolicibacterium sp.]|uniref:SDR family NAD(P)-dependent oxidoreductase n=1 Tax=Mycolicibacterium sp. TaxID=2320850 RepID=UPI003D0F1BFD
MRGLQQKVAVVVGGGSGIGLATGLRLAAEGTRVGVVDIDGTDARAAADRIGADGGQALAVPADATSEAAMTAAVAEVAGAFGGVDILVNSVARVKRLTMADTTFADWRQMIDDCLHSYFLATKAVIPHLLARGGGRIVNICSMLAHVGSGLPAYTAAKGAILAWSRENAVELGRHGITVNSVSPGVIRTPINAAILDSEELRRQVLDLIPRGRLGKPEDVAAAVAFLVSADADFVTGADLVIDGAMSSSTRWGNAWGAWDQPSISPD